MESFYIILQTEKAERCLPVTYYSKGQNTRKPRVGKTLVVNLTFIQSSILSAPYTTDSRNYSNPVRPSKSWHNRMYYWVGVYSELFVLGYDLAFHNEPVLKCVWFRIWVTHLHYTQK